MITLLLYSIIAVALILIVTQIIVPTVAKQPMFPSFRKSNSIDLELDSLEQELTLTRLRLARLEPIAENIEQINELKEKISALSQQKVKEKND